MPLRITFTAEAEKDVDDAIDFVSMDNPTAAGGLAERIEKSLRLLAERPYLGRQAPETGQPGMRRMAVPPYVVFYFVGQQAVQVVRVLHGARQLEDRKLYREKDAE